MKRKVALITGIGGQDGSYLAEFLLDKGYLVRGIIRRASLPNTKRFEHLVMKYGASDDPNTPFRVEYADLTDPQSLRKVIDKFKPDEEMFGIAPPPQSETTAMLPQSPYGIAKLAAYHLTRLYRNAYGLFACNGILFNHESPRRGFNFVTKKITKELSRIVVGELDKITLGNLDAKRDWGFSKEYIEAMWAILQQDKPDDFVIATEETHTVRDFLKESFALVGLNYEDYLQTSDKFHRPAEVPALLGNAQKAKLHLKWEPKVKFKELAHMMVDADLKEKLEETGLLPIQPGVVRENGYYIQKAKEILASRQGQSVQPSVENFSI